MRNAKRANVGGGRGTWDLSALRFYFVDDYRPMHLVVRSMLTALEVRHVRCFEQGSEAVKRIDARNPDLLITDFAMDGMNGVELIRAVRSEASPNRYLPIIMLTGYASPQVVQAARDAGVNGVVAKPLSISALYRRIAAIIQENRPYIEAPNYFGPDRRRREAIYDGPDRRKSSSEIMWDADENRTAAPV